MSSRSQSQESIRYRYELRTALKNRKLVGWLQPNWGNVSCVRLLPLKLYFMNSAFSEFQIQFKRIDETDCCVSKEKL